MVHVHRGESFDVAIGLDVDRAGNVVVTGPTGSQDFPTIPGAYQRQFAGGDSDTFVTKLDRSGSRLLFSTLLDGAAGEAGFISFLDARGDVYVEGETGSADSRPLVRPSRRCTAAIPPTGS